MNKIKKVLFRIIISIQIIMTLLSPMGVMAHLDEEFDDHDPQVIVGKQIRDYAIRFVHKANSIHSGIITDYNTDYTDESLVTGDPTQLVLYGRAQRSSTYDYLAQRRTNLIEER